MRRLKLIVPLLLLMFPLAGALEMRLTAHAGNDFQVINWESLDLSSSQRTQLQQLDQHWRSVVSEIAPRVRLNERRLKQLMSSSSPDDSEILQLQQQIQEDRAKLKMEATHIYLDKRKLLNGSQQEKLERMIQLH